MPYTVGSSLKQAVQIAEDSLQETLGGDRVRTVEKGGEILSNILGRADPWASQRTCGDNSCWTCESGVWITTKVKESRKSGTPLPKDLVLPRSRNCRREGLTYSIQCMTCMSLGKKTLYQGESASSARQRHHQHHKDLEQGVAASPLVHHAVETHGGVRPHFVAVIGALEPKPLQRAVREAANISCLPHGDGNMNRCLEWGCPRVPVMNVSGGDEQRDRTRPQETQQGPENPCPNWTQKILGVIKEGRTARVRLTRTDEAMNLRDIGEGEDLDPEDLWARRPMNKKARMETGRELLKMENDKNGECQEHQVQQESRDQKLCNPDEKQQTPPPPPEDHKKQQGQQENSEIKSEQCTLEEQPTTPPPLSETDVKYHQKTRISQQIVQQGQQEKRDNPTDAKDQDNNKDRVFRFGSTDIRTRRQEDLVRQPEPRRVRPGMLKLNKKKLGAQRSAMGSWLASPKSTTPAPRSKNTTDKTVDPEKEKLSGAKGAGKRVSQKPELPVERAKSEENAEIESVAGDRIMKRDVRDRLVSEPEEVRAKDKLTHLPWDG